MAGFKKERGDWKRFRNLPQVREFDLHRSDQAGPYGWMPPYDERMSAVYNDVLQEIQSAYEGGEHRYVLITHGWSTSRPGKTTSRSQVRRLMRSKEVTPYIIRKECIQHDSVFVVAIRSRYILACDQRDLS